MLNTMLNTMVSVPLVYIISVAAMYALILGVEIYRSGRKAFTHGHLVLIVSAIFQALLGWGTVVIVLSLGAVVTLAAVVIHRKRYR